MFSLFTGFGDRGPGEKWRAGIAGEVFDEVSPRIDAGRLLAGLYTLCGGLPAVEGAGDRSCAGLGEMGTFQMIASSGNSSSSSSHSASRSLAVLRAVCCHDWRRSRAVIEGVGETSSLRELERESERAAEENACDFEGEGEREDRVGAAGDKLASEGAEGEVNPRLTDLPGALSCDCGLTALLTCPFRLGYRGLELLVRSRNEWAAACGCELPRWLEGREASNITRLEGDVGMWKDEGAPCRSSRLMSSKWERSLWPMPSGRLAEWKDDDLDDLELVRSGGLSGEASAM